MDKSRLSLMTFPMGIDIFRRTMTIEESFRVASEAGIQYVDVMGVSKKKLEE